MPMEEIPEVQWFGVLNKDRTRVIAFVSNDSQDFEKIEPADLVAIDQNRQPGKGESVDATGRLIVAINVVTPEETLRLSLIAKNPATAVLADVFQGIQLLLKLTRF